MKEDNLQKNFNVPNAISVVRILLVLPFVLFFARFLRENDNRYLLYCFVIVAVSGLSDFFDGFIARKYNLVTTVGKFLDPVSDKLTQAAIIICFAFWIPQTIPLAIAFFVKELSMLLGSVFLVNDGKRPTESKWFGKVSTFVFFIGAVILIGVQVFTNGIPGWLMITVTAVCSLLMLVALAGYIVVYIKLKNNTYTESSK